MLQPKRAFVVMPFGKKRLDAVPSQFRNTDLKDAAQEINFDDVYKSLLEPALQRANCDPVRADSETAAGDIRTDMFFELVTADLVVADISMADPNVFYELGVRHGVCPGGVFVVHNSLLNSRPFDVYVDRTFPYEGSLFTVSTDAATESARARALEKAVADLAETLKRAIEGDRQTTGSPVYGHLPGLIPVNWDHIETSRSKFFGELNNDWLDLVREAQVNGYPGDIQTMADDAPTLFRRNKIRYSATLALIGLCRWDAAERDLRMVVEQDPDNLDAKLQLGLVLARQGKNALAETHLRRILEQHGAEPAAADLLDLLGQVYRHLWHLAWSGPKETRRQKAIASVGQAAQAVQSFRRAQQLNPSAYFAGFNALILFAVVNDLFDQEKKHPPEVWRAIPTQKMKELLTVVQFCAENAQESARSSDDSLEQFWATTTLSGLALMRNDVALALDRIKEACSIPNATLFQLSTFEQRLILLDELDFRPDFVKPALEIVSNTLKSKQSKDSACNRVFLWAGYPLDPSTASTPRFPEESIDDVQTGISKALDKWDVKKGDLAICEGVHEGDVLFAEECLKRGASVRLMLLDMDHTGLEQTLWPFQSDQWEERFKRLWSGGAEVWFHSKRLGSFHDESDRGPRLLRYRHRNWIINTARFEAEPSGDAASGVTASSPARLYGLFLWNGEIDDYDPENPSFFVQRVNEFGDYRGELKIIRAIAAQPGPMAEAAKAR